jgi:DHA2 family multidrug resistance protein
MTATQSGLALMPRSLAMMVAMPLGGILYNRIGPRWMIIAGLLMSAWTQFVFARSTLATDAGSLIGPLVIQGIGLALAFVAMSTAAFSTVERAKMTSATGINNLIRQLGGSIGTAVVVNILTIHIDGARSALVSNVNSASPATLERIREMSSYFVTQGFSTQSAQGLAMGSIYSSIQQQAAVLSYDFVFTWIGIIFLLCIPFAFLLAGASNTAKPPVPVVHSD